MNQKPSVFIAQLDQKVAVLSAEHAQLSQRLEEVKGDLKFCAGQRHILAQLPDKNDGDDDEGKKPDPTPEKPAGAPEDNGTRKNRILQAASRSKKARKAGIS